MNSKDKFIEYTRPKLEIKKPRVLFMPNQASAQPMDILDCLIMAQGDKSNLLGVAYASVDEGKICGFALCIVPTHDAAERSGIYPVFKRWN